MIASTNSKRNHTSESDIVERFVYDPEGAYDALLEHYSPVILRMIHRFTRDHDEVMEIYTSICERFRANDFQALRRFRTNSELTPWLSVVVANACRDLFRRKKASSVPKSVINQLDELEKLVFRYYYQERLQHEDIAEIINSRHDVKCSALEVVEAIGKINDLLSVKKRWHLLTALNQNRPPMSIEEMAEYGFEPAEPGDYSETDISLRDRESVEKLNHALNSLSDEDQLIVLLRFEQGMTAVQIADLMKFDSHKYVYTRLRTIVNRLRRMLEGVI